MFESESISVKNAFTHPIVLENVRDYFDAGETFLKSIDLGNIQKDSYRSFIDMVIPYYLNRTYKLSIGTNTDIDLSFKNWYIDTSNTHSIEYCKDNKLSYEAGIRATAMIKINKHSEAKVSVSPHVRVQDVLITKFPLLTENGNLIINGIEKILVSHLESSCKIRLETVLQKHNKGKKQLKFSVADRIKIGSSRTRMMNNTLVISESKNNNGYDIAIGGKIYSVTNILKELTKGALSPSVMREILGISNKITATIDSTSIFTGYFKDPYESIKSFNLRLNERMNLNERLSYSYRAVGRVLAKDIVDGDNVIAYSGQIVTEEIANEAQYLGLNLYVYPSSGINTPLRVINNNFISADILYKHHPEYGEIPSFLKGLQINRLKFYEIINNAINKGISPTVYKSILEINYDDLVGTYLLTDDIISIINLYGAFLSNDVEEDDIDSLSVKSIVNIAQLYEEALGLRFRDGKGFKDSAGDESCMTGKIRRDFADYKKKSGNTEAGVSEDNYMSLIIDLDCPPESTITAQLTGYSLLDQADSTSPLAWLNHRRKISSKKVIDRGGTPSNSSDVRPRSVNPSYMGRIDVVESPEGENVGLVNYLATLARVNYQGIIEAPFFLVDKVKKQIDYTKVYYLDYDVEKKLVRASSEVSNKDELVIEIYKNNELIKTKQYPVTYKKYKYTKTKKYDFSNFYTQMYSDNNTVDDEEETYAGSFDVDSNIDYDTVASELMQSVGGDEYKISKYKKNWFKDDTIVCSVGHGGVKKVKAEEADVVIVSGEHIFGVVSSTVPFADHNDAARLMMGTSHGKQAICIDGAESPTISTFMQDKIGDYAVGVVLSPVTGIVKYVDSSKVVIQSLSGNITEIPLISKFRTVENTMLYSVPAVNVGDFVDKGDLIADSNMTSNGSLAHGTELRVAYLSWNGFNYEDGIVLSDRLIKDNTLTSHHIVEHRLILNSSEPPYKQALKLDISTENKEEYKDIYKSLSLVDISKFDENYLLKPGTVVKPNDVMAYYMIVDDIGGYGVNVKMSLKSLRYTGTDIVYVLDSQIVTINDELQILIKTASDEIIIAGDKLSGRHGNKGVVAKILPEYEMPFDEDGNRMDVLLTPLGLPSRMNMGQVIECQLNPLLKNCGLKAKIATMKKMDMDALRDYLIQTRQIVKSNISILDCNNKVTKIGTTNEVTESEPIVLEKGLYNIYTYKTPTEVINIKVELLDSNETYCTEDIGYTVINSSNINSQDMFLLYSDKPGAIDVTEDNSVKFLRSGEAYISAIGLCIPEKAKVTFVTRILPSNDDKLQLYDGRTGEPYELKTNAGICVMLKLKHQVSHKIHARSVGKYKTSQQPTQGKENDGGQKLGAMELWSLVEQGVNNVMNEFLTYKSDDVAGRKRMQNFIDEKRKGTVNEGLLVTDKTNSPYSHKVIDALLKSGFINMVYYNKDGKPISIYEDICKNDMTNMGVRDLESLIRKQREDVHQRFIETLGYVKIGDGRFIEKKTSSVINRGDMPQIRLTYQSLGENQDILIAPVEGYSDDYYYFGSSNQTYKMSMNELLNPTDYTGEMAESMNSFLDNDDSWEDEIVGENDVFENRVESAKSINTEDSENYVASLLNQTMSVNSTEFYSVEIAEDVAEEDINDESDMGEEALSDEELDEV